MKKIKICYLIVNCKITGPMNQTLNIIKNLDKEIFNVCFITLFDEEINNSMIEEYRKVCKENYCLHLNKISSLIYGKYKLKKLLDNVSPDIIHSLGMPPFRLSLFYKDAKHFTTLRNYPYEDYPSYYNKYFGPILAFFDIILIKKMSKKSKSFVTCSHSLSNIYNEKQNLKIDYISNGVDINKFQISQPNEKKNIRKKLGLPENKIIYIYAAPFNERKDQEFAIKGFLNSSNLDNKYLILCGNGYTFNNLKNKYANEKEILFTGKVTNISDYLKASDIYISTSKSEGLPNSVLEAMASGLCVLLSNIIQHKEIFDVDKNIGLLYELGNDEDIVKKINEIINLDYNRIGKHCRKVIEDNFTSKIMSEKYQEIYQELAGD